MKKKAISIFLFSSASFIATSCSLFSVKVFDWMTATNNNAEINYCLLIGQNEHSDSIERTRYTREALNTRDPATEVNGNANLGRPKQGKIILGEGASGVKPKEFIVNELEHMEQKSLAGVVWDAITANGTTATWIAKHGKKITMFVSNNDGMAEGCLSASNYIKGLPLFGYDANTSTLKKIKQGVIMGTVDQNASAQTAASYLIIRNILEDQKTGKNEIGTVNYDPTNRGFRGKTQPTDYGFYIDGFDVNDPEGGIVDPHLDENNLILDGTGAHEILSASVAISDQDIDGYIDPVSGEVYKPAKLAFDDDKGFVHVTSDYHKPTDSYKVCHIYNNVAETYLQTTMHDYFTQYAGNDSATHGNCLNLDITKVDGDGVDESAIFNKVHSVSQSIKFDAFLVNMVTTTDGPTFISTLAEIAAKNEGKSLPDAGWSKFEDRLDTPIVFWNRQPKKVNGDLDTETMNNKFFKYTYYVGVDAAYGGRRQGQMILSYLERQYIKSLQ